MDYSGDNVQMNEEQPIEQPPTEPAHNEQRPAEPVRKEQSPAEFVRSEPQPPDPRRRLRELLAIPDHQRTDALWDEIIELEICLAPGNRVQGPPGMQPEPGRRQGASQGRRPEQARRPDQTPGLKPAKRFFKKPKRPPGLPPKT
jgi:hypothetical protein